MEYIKKITLDINSSLPYFIDAKQWDSLSRFIEFTLISNSSPINLTNHQVKVFALKPDGTRIFNDVDILDAPAGKVLVKLTRQLLAVAGQVKAELSIYGNDNSVLTTKDFIINVLPSVKNEDLIESSDEFSALTDSITKLATAIGSAEMLQELEQELEDAIQRGDMETLLARQDSLETTFQQLIINAGNSNAEIVDARVKADNTVYPTLRDRLNDVDSQLADMSDYMYGITINVMDKRFAGGAKPNQVDVDSLPAFNAARDYVENYSYATIKIPAGVYYIDDYFEFPSNCRIIGDGKYKTIIRPTQNYLAKLKAKVDNKPGLFINKNWNVEGIAQYQAVRNVLIQDIGFVFDEDDTSTNYLANAITLVNSGKVTISGCYSLKFPNHLIDIGNCEHVTVERCISDGHVFSPIQIDCDNGGVPGAIAPTGRSKHINIRYNIITNVTVTDRPAIHIHKNGGDHINIEHNIIENCPFGIGTDDYFVDNFAIQHMSYVRIRNNTIINATSYGIGLNTALINSAVENNHIINAIKGIQLKPNVSSSTLIKSTCRITGNDVNAEIPLTIYGLELSQITGNKCVATVANNPIIDIYGIQKSNIDKNTLVGKTNSIGIKINPLSLTDPRDSSVYTYICSLNNIARNVFDTMLKAIVITDNSPIIDTRIIGNIYSAVTTKYDLTSAYKRKIYISDNEPYISDFMLIDTTENKTKTYNHYMDFSNRVAKITLLVADDANGTNVREIPHCAISGNIGITVKLTDTQYTIQAGSAGLFYDIDSSGTTTLRTSAYARIILS